MKDDSYSCTVGLFGLRNGHGRYAETERQVDALERLVVAGLSQFGTELWPCRGSALSTRKWAGLYVATGVGVWLAGTGRLSADEVAKRLQQSPWLGDAQPQLTEGLHYMLRVEAVARNRDRYNGFKTSMATCIADIDRLDTALHTNLARG